MLNNINKRPMIKNQNESRLGIKSRQRGSLRFKTRHLIIAATAVFFIAGATFLYLNIGVTRQVKAAVAGDYRTLISGNWNGLATWEKYDGSNWIATITSPTSADGTITIQSGHTVTVTASVTVNQVEVNSGGTLNVNSGTLTLSNVAGTELSISGTTNLKSGGILTIAAGSSINVLNGGTYNYNGGTQTLTGWTISNGGTYVHNVNNINIPTASWGVSSTIKITGVTSADLKGCNQSFGHFIYNSTSQTGPVEFWESITAINGNLTVLSTGTGSIFLKKASAVIPLNIAGNYYQSGGTVYLTKGGVFTINLQGTFTLDGGTFVEVERYGMPVMNVYGLFTINAGTFNHSTYLNNNSNEGIGIVNLFNNYIRTGGLHTETSTGTGRGEFNFTKSGTQTFVHTGGTITNTVNFTVINGSVLDLADYMVTGGGSFTLMSGGGLILGSANGITSSGATGNVQVTGTRNFSTNGDYTYNGLSAQVSGNGLPATIRNLTVNNANNLTLSGSSSATAVITMTDGKIITGSYELGSTNTNPSGIVSYTDVNYVVGKLRRSVAASGNYEFPVGTMTNYEFASVTLSSMTGFTDILGYFTNADPIEPAYPLTGLTINGTTIADILNYGYWALSPNSAMTGGTYSVMLKEKGHTNSSEDPNEYGILKRVGAGSPWQSHGTHINGTQSETGGVATVVRSDLNAFSHFSIGRGSGPLPVALIVFNAKVSGSSVVCSWQTATEVNNDYFTLQRSKDGRNFEEVARIDGAGYTSNEHRYSYTDRKPLEGLSYYRLKQTDYDGKTEVFHVVSVNTKSSLAVSETIHVIPNPVIDDFSIQFTAQHEGQATIIISALNGVTVLNREINFEEGKNSYPLTFPPLSGPGTYVLRVINDDLALPAVKVVRRRG